MVVSIEYFYKYMLGRMKTGRIRKPSANALEYRALDWINNAK